MLPLLLPDSPVAIWWPADPPGRPGRRPARRPGPAPDHRLPPAPSAGKRGDRTTSARRTPRATPTWPGPGSPRGGRCSPRRSTSTRSKVTVRVGRPPRRSARAPTCSPPGSPTGSRSTVDRQHVRRARHHRGGAGDPAGPDPDLAARRQARDVLLPGPAGPAGRAQAARPARAARRGAAPARRGRRVRRHGEIPGGSQNGATKKAATRRKPAAAKSTRAKAAKK